MADQGDLFAGNGEAMTAARVWQVLERWQAQGWIRALDLALVRMLADLDPTASVELLLGACMASHQLGRGHICLDLEVTLRDPDAALSLPPEGAFGEALPDRPSQVLQGWTLERWLDALAASPLVAGDEAAAGDNTGAPLVLDRRPPARLYLRRQWQYERDVAAALRQRLRLPAALPDAVRPLLDQLFPTPASERVDWQRAACALAAMTPFSIITGGPGTGKTTTVVRLLALLQSRARAQGQKLRIRLAAPTGKAAARLTESISLALATLPAGMAEGVPSDVSTLHRLLGSRPDSRHFRHHEQNPLHADLVVVDEASMIDLEMMHALLRALPARAGLVLLGDKDQLASVEAGAVLGDLCQLAHLGGYRPQVLQALAAAGAGDLTQWQHDEGRAGDEALAQQIVMLRHSHRFGADSGIGRLARAVNAGDSTEALALLQQGRPDVALLETPAELDTALRRLILEGATLGRQGAVAGFTPYLSQLKAQRPTAADYRDPQWCDWARALLQAFGDFRLLCALRRGPWGVEGLNERIEQLLAQAGALATHETWYDGRPVMVTHNDYGLGLMNGDIGICLRVPRADGDTALRVVFPMPGGELKWVLPSRLQNVETVFAMTVHKSQGSEFTHTALVLPPTPNPVLTRELVYTGITRARSAFTLLLPVRARLLEAIATRVHRASALRQRVLAAAEPGG